MTALRTSIDLANREWETARFRVRMLRTAEWVIAILAVVCAAFVNLACLSVIVLSAGLWMYRFMYAEPALRNAFQHARICTIALIYEEDDARRESQRNRRVATGTFGRRVGAEWN